MDTQEAPCFVTQSRLKTARRRKRLRKTATDKNLIRLHHQLQALYAQRRSLPLIALDTPYQKGWKRFFVLREDVARSKYADFYNRLLEQINTTQLSRDKTYKAGKKRKRKTGQVIRPQYLKAFSQWEWSSPRLKLTEVERKHFHPVEVRSRCGRYQEVRYVFNAPWRYVLRIKPNMITHVRMPDAALEREIDRLSNYLERAHLEPRMKRLVYGRAYHGRSRLYEKQPDPLFNKPLHRILDECSINDNP